MGFRQAERGGAAHGQPREMRLLDPEPVHQREGVVEQRREAVAAGGSVGAAVPALIVAQDAILLLELIRLLVPHRQIGGERVAEDEPGRALRPVHLVVDVDAVGLDLHRHYPFTRRAPSVAAACAPRKSCSSASSTGAACAGIMCTPSISSNRALGMVCANCSLAAGGRTWSKRPATTMVGTRISLARCVTLGRAIARFMDAKQTGSCAR